MWTGRMNERTENHWPAYIYICKCKIYIISSFYACLQICIYANENALWARHVGSNIRPSVHNLSSAIDWVDVTQIWRDSSRGFKYSSFLTLSQNSFRLIISAIIISLQCLWIQLLSSALHFLPIKKKISKISISYQILLFCRPACKNAWCTSPSSFISSTFSIYTNFWSLYCSKRTSSWKDCENTI